MSLPFELLLRVFSLLTPREVVKCRQVCTAWRDVSYDPSVWRLCYARFVRTFEDDPLIAAPDDQLPVDWEHLYTLLRTRETNWARGHSQYHLRWQAHTTDVLCLALCNHILVTASTAAIRVWDLRASPRDRRPPFLEREMHDTPARIQIARRHNKLLVVTIALSGQVYVLTRIPDSSVLTKINTHLFTHKLITRLIQIYNLKTLDHSGEIHLHDYISAVSLAEDRDENLVVATYSGLVKVFDIEDGTMLFEMDMARHELTVVYTFLHPPNLLLATKPPMIITMHTPSRTPVSALTPPSITNDLSILPLWAAHRTHLYRSALSTLAHHPLLPTGVPVPDPDNPNQPAIRRECHVPGTVMALACGGSRGRAAAVVEKRVDGIKGFHLYVYDPRDGIAAVREWRIEGGSADAWPVAVDEERIVVGRKRGEVAVCGFGVRDANGR
ncbi:hypothetical protein BC937DRAFT_89656 [Endogone sp. FLAS-F59071]|nr:hypothetical protein BC937DRAFT_89656 [Endogone sp. FLAS-F59071]|eukprot:RUS22327.1 hypothetical protein BC937DRAFT_89656 [Endogone sp. FLAS-F59071]